MGAGVEIQFQGQNKMAPKAQVATVETSNEPIARVDTAVMSLRLQLRGSPWISRSGLDKHDKDSADRRWKERWQETESHFGGLADRVS
jgi:hypothetical protein